MKNGLLAISALLLIASFSLQAVEEYTPGTEQPQGEPTAEGHVQPPAQGGNVPRWNWRNNWGGWGRWGGQGWGWNQNQYRRYNPYNQWNQQVEDNYGGWGW